MECLTKMHELINAWYWMFQHNMVDWTVIYLATAALLCIVWCWAIDRTS
jgi:hypothetical protein